jgi:hypothetical protein
MGQLQQGFTAGEMGFYVNLRGSNPKPMSASADIHPPTTDVRFTPNSGHGPARR